MPKMPKQMDKGNVSAEHSHYELIEWTKDGSPWPIILEQARVSPDSVLILRPWRREILEDRVLRAVEEIRRIPGARVLVLAREIDLVHKELWELERLVEQKRAELGGLEALEKFVEGLSGPRE